LIHVNLLPGGKKGAAKSKGGGLSLKLPEMKGLPKDKWAIGSAAAVVVALAAIAFLFMGLRSDREEVQVQLDEAVQDSARFADLIARTALLTARRDSIAQKVGIIQGIDQNRYIWPHLLDELSRALPDYTWLSEVTQTASEPISVRLVGQAGNNFALTVFMEQLEASAFLQGVTLIQSQQELINQQVVSGFTLEVQYIQPPMEFLQTVPLFEGSSATQTEVQDSAAAAPAGTPAAPGN
jgi:Tfp pilus assembly protein PilN